MVGAGLANLADGQKKEGAPIDAPVTQDEVAELLNTSRRNIQRATKVQSQTVSTASEITTLPPEEQTELVARGEAEIIQKAKEIRQAKTEKT